MIRLILKNSCLIFLITILISGSLAPMINGFSVEKGKFSKDLSFCSGNIIYVDGNSKCPGNGSREWPYCKIQYAIDNSSYGDIIRVFNGTYSENLRVYTSISILGNGSGCTILRGGNDYEQPVVDITAANVIISNFEIIGNNTEALIKTVGDNTTIVKNILDQSSSEIISSGIFLKGTSGCIVENNSILGPAYNFILSDLGKGITLFSCFDNNLIKNNYIIAYGEGINVEQSSSCVISDNTLYDNNLGINLIRSNSNTVEYNKIKNNNQEGRGISLFVCQNNKIIKNQVSGFQMGIFMFNTYLNRFFLNNISYNEVNIRLIVSILDRIFLNNVQYAVSGWGLRTIISFSFIEGNWWGDRFGPLRKVFPYQQIIFCFPPIIKPIEDSPLAAFLASFWEIFRYRLGNGFINSEIIRFIGG